MIGKYECQQLLGGFGEGIRQNVDGMCDHPECNPETEEKMERETFRIILKRIIRQLDQRIQNKKSELSYQNKRKEFIELIDKAKQTDWFVMPKKSTRIFKIYYDKWD